MNSAKLIKIHTCIAKMRIIFLIVFVIGYFLGILVDLWEVNYSVKMIPKALILLLIISDYIYSIQSYHLNFRIIQAIRIPLAMLAFSNIVINKTQPYLIAISMILFIIVLIQILYFTDIIRLRYRLGIFYLVILPTMVISAIDAMQMNQNKLTITTIVFYFVLIVYMNFFIVFTSRIFAESYLEIKKLKGELRKIKRIRGQESDMQLSPWDNAYEKLSHENSEMLIENLIQQYISSSLEISNLMKLILESLSEALVVNLCSIIVKEENGENYQYNSRTIGNSFKLENFNSYIEDGKLVDEFKDLRIPFVDNQVDIKKYVFLAGMDVRSLLVYPLVNEGEWLGMLVIAKDTNDYFVDNMSFFERVSTQFSIALMNARIYTKMKNMAMKDGLAGIYNRTYMTQKVNEYISDIVLNKGALAVLLFDIDKFKKVNDTYGHLFGDEVIRVCANKAKDIADQYHGFAARYGGEEFVIVCKEGSLQELHRLSETLHTQIKQTEISYRGSSLFVNVSIGVASFPATCDNPAELIDRADKAMYHSKISGRGRITFDGEYVPH